MSRVSHFLGVTFLHHSDVSIVGKIVLSPPSQSDADTHSKVKCQPVTIVRGGVRPANEKVPCRLPGLLFSGRLLAF